MIFDPVRDRAAYLRNNSATLTYYLCKRYDVTLPMGNVARMQLDAVLTLWLVGLNVEIAPALDQLLNWLDRPTPVDERFGESRHFHSMGIQKAKGVALWMTNGTAATSTWSSACELNARALAETWVIRGAGMPDQVGRVWGERDIPTLRLDEYMALCFQSEQYQLGIEEYEKYHGNSEPSLKKTLKPRELGYALCLHKARDRFDPDALHVAGRKMLRSRLEEKWLGAGQNIEAAMWLKIVHWHHDPSLSPLQTILKAYDDMPHVERPSWL